MDAVEIALHVWLHKRIHQGRYRALIFAIFVEQAVRYGERPADLFERSGNRLLGRRIRIGMQVADGKHFGTTRFAEAPDFGQRLFG